MLAVCMNIIFLSSLLSVFVATLYLEGYWPNAHFFHNYNIVFDDRSLLPFSRGERSLEVDHDHIVFYLQILQYFGSIYYTGNMLIRYLCEHDTDILFTFCIQNGRIYRFIQICLHGTSKNSIVFSPLLF